MTNPWLNLLINATGLAFEAQEVVMLRTARIAAGGASGEHETVRMFTEKVSAFVEAGAAMSMALATGQSPEAISHDLVRHYRHAVHQNALRLAE